MADIDPDKALAALEAERERRLQAKIDAGEIVSVQTHVVVHRGESVEAATARAIDKHPVPDDGRHHRTLFYIYTGVPGPPRGPDYGETTVQTISSERNLSDLSEEPAGSGAVLPSAATSQPTPVYIWVTVSNGGDGDPGAIAEAWWTIEDGALVLRGADDKHITSRAMLKNEDPEVLAKSLPIRYPKLGLA